MLALLGRMSRELPTIKANLLSASRGELPKFIVVTSAMVGEGKTLTALAIAYSMAKYSQVKVLLVDGDDAQADITRQFRLEGAPGVVDVLLYGAEPSQATVPSDIGNLHVMPFGNRGPDQAHLYEGEAFPRMCDAIRREYDVVVFDVPAFMTSSSAALAVKQAEGVVLVVECEKTKLPVVSQVRDKIERVGGRIIGVVMNRRQFHIPRWLYKWL